MKRVYLIILVLLPISLFSQEVRDVIYLKNQSVIKGHIIERKSDIIRIETKCENILAFSPDEIITIETEVVETNKNLKSKGYINYTTIGALVGDSENSEPAPFSLLMEHNYHVNNYLSLGVLTGIELLNESTFPVGLIVKGLKPISNGATLFLGATGGYSISLEKPAMENYTVKSATGGILVNTEFGLIISTEGNAGFVVAIGYRYNTLNYVREDWLMQEVERKMTFNRLSVRFGIVLY